MSDVIVTRLQERGVPDEEIEEARTEGRLGLLAVDRLLLGVPRYTIAEAAERAGLDADFARRLWRSTGFPDVGDDEPALTDADVDAWTTVADILEQGLADPDVTSQLTRVIGSSLARIADAQMGALQGRLERLISDGQQLDEVNVASVVVDMFDTLRPDFGRLLGYVYDRHLNAALKRAPFWHEHDGGQHRFTVGFADLVGFTALSQELDESQLAAVVDRFENLAYETVSRLRGRIVKVIGDEVMFATEDVAAAAETALSLAEAYAEDETLSDVRVGLACGPVLNYEGDLFGPVVNLASRIVNIAYAGTVVTSQEVYDALEGHTGFGWKPIRPRRLKGIGWTPLWALYRPGMARPGAGSRVASEVARRVRTRRQLRGALPSVPRTD